MTHRRAGSGPPVLCVALAAVAILASACGSSGSSPDPGASSQPAGSGDGSASTSPSSALGKLIADAQREGSLTTIGLQRDRCNYAEAIDTFTSRYGIHVTELAPTATSAEQIDAVERGKDGSDPRAPDVVDVDRASADRARADGLLAPYEVATWADIPAPAKDPDGHWAGDYYDLPVFESNTSVVAEPASDWNGLLEASRGKQVALPGDPRTVDDASLAVYAAALAQPGGSLDDARPGLAFFRQLNEAGNLVAKAATSKTIDGGSTPTAIRPSSVALAHRAAATDASTLDVTVPEHGRLGVFSVQAIGVGAPHPNAARLWLEFLYSDDGQNIWLEGDCNPIRLEAMVAANAIPTDLLAHVPDSSGVVFPSVEQLDRARTAIRKGWDATVRVDIK
jgi:putative spermidine/putrescine transport system substrate-binding protein